MPNVVDRIAELVEQTGIDAFGAERLFELFQFDACSLDLQVHAPKLFTWGRLTQR